MSKMITVENYSEHAYDFCLFSKNVLVPRASLEQGPNPNMQAQLRPGRGEIPENMLVRLLKERAVRSWFESGQCKVVGASLEGLIAQPAEPDPSPVRAAVESQIGAARATLADNARLAAENAALIERIAALEKGAKKG